MNTTDSFESSDTNVIGSHPMGSFGYGLGLSLGVLIIFVIISYVSYTCKRHCGEGTTLNDPSYAHDRRYADTTDDDSSIVITIHRNGLDEATLSSYPQFTYSKLKPHKTDSTASGCSICLADYKDNDLLKLLPDCGHIFHVKCIDPWLMLNPTCPICRNSRLTTPVQTPLAQPAPVSTL